MRIVFMGTPAISATCLRRIHEDGCNIVGVYTKPDTPKNRGMKMAMSEVKIYAQSVGLPVYQPTTFKDDAVVEELKALQPDLILVVDLSSGPSSTAWTRPASPPCTWRRKWMLAI